jgi:hypothetical protein
MAGAGGGTTQIVDAPALRTSTPAPNTANADTLEASAPRTGDGNVQAGDGT